GAWTDWNRAAVTVTRREGLGARADRDTGESGELLSVAAFIAALTNEPADDVAALATRALAVESSSTSGPFARATLALVWAERYAQVRPLLDAVVAQSRA